VSGLALHGEFLWMTLFPDCGAKILNLAYKPRDVDLLWTNPRVPLTKTYPGAAFDDVWAGGWDELFPTDPPCELEGNTYHDHGDLWHGPWEWTIEKDDGEEARIYLRRYAVSLPCLMEKWVTFRRGELHVGFHHRLTNLGLQAVPFAWSLHVAHPIAPDSRIHLPAESMAAVPDQAGRFASSPDALGWPVHEAVDLSAVLAPESGLTEWLYARRLLEGWCAVTHPAAGLGLGIAFDHRLFETVWLWGVYGGWRGHYVLLTEPSTSPPGGLARNVAEGTAARLEPGGVLETTVVATVFEHADGPLAGDERPKNVPLLVESETPSPEPGSA
jgi:hypothetical protein